MSLRTSEHKTFAFFKPFRSSSKQVAIRIWKTKLWSLTFPSIPPALPWDILLVFLKIHNPVDNAALFRFTHHHNCRKKKKMRVWHPSYMFLGQVYYECEMKWRVLSRRRKAKTRRCASSVSLSFISALGQLHSVYVISCVLGFVKLKLFKNREAEFLFLNPSTQAKRFCW